MTTSQSPTSTFSTTAAQTGTPYLTKSSYVRATKCPRLLWLSWHRRLPYEEPQPGSPAAIGIEIGEHAQRLFPDGVLVDEAPWQHDEAVARTAELMSDPSVPAIFEAALEADGIRIRADVIERLPDGGWGLREVKSSTRVKADYAADAAIQAHVMARSGVAPASIELIHVDRDYVYAGGPIDWPAFFARTDIAEQVAAERIDIDDLISEFQHVLNTDAEPAIEPGPHCPQPCDYWEHCTAAKPADWTMHLPRMTARRFEELSARGIERISEIPADFDLTEHQDRMRDVIVSARPYVSPGLANALAILEGPLSYIDFEAMNPAIPVYPGTRPYERLPFQWSLHQDDGNGGLTHQDFLAEADRTLDPRPAFTETLVDALGPGTSPVVVYSPYERTVLQDMARQFPHLAADIEAIISRLVDLYVIVRDHVYLAGFNGSFSIKTVGRALAPHFTYDGLDHVSNGEQAAAAFQRLISTDLPPGEGATLRDALLAYCRLDTLALVETHRALKRLAAGTT